MAVNERRNARDNSRSGFEKRQKRRQIRALQEAIDKNDIETVREILQEEFDVDFQYRSQTGLQLAVKEGCYEICQLLIAKGANVNMADAEQNNLLNMACWRGHARIVELLVENKAEIDDPNLNGLTPLHTCASRGYPDILQFLMSSGGCADIPNQHGQTALHTAVKQQNLEMVQLLILGGCNINRIDEQRRTPLAVAAELGYADIAQILINGGANINVQDRIGSTPLFEAVSNGQLNVAEILVQAGADVNLAVTKGQSPLLESISNGRTDISLFLIQAGCNVNQTDRLKQAPLHSAVTRVSQFFSQETEQAMLLIRTLVEAGADLNAANQHGVRPLYQSASGGNIELTEYILSKGVDLNVTTNMGDTILHAGVHGNKPALVEILIKAGCAVNERNNDGEHALLTAVIYHSDIQIIEALVKAGSNIDLKDKAGLNTALHKAILHYYSEAAELLIDSGCDVNALNDKRNSPLYIACEKNDDIVARKIMCSPRFSRKVLKIPTIPQPLFAAVGNAHVHLVDLLIQTGCDINMANVIHLKVLTPLNIPTPCLTYVNVDGLSPVQLAIQEKCTFVTKLLLKYNCDLEAHAKVTRLMKCCLLHEDRHPHFDLEPLFLALTHRCVDMLQLIINCYWTVPIKILRMLDKVFKSTPDLQSHYSPELKAKIQEIFRVSTKVPRSLQQCCRAALRKEIGPCPEQKVESLPLAKKLKDYVLMEEYFSDLFENFKHEEQAHPADFHGFHSVGAEDSP